MHHPSLRLGLQQINGLAEATARRIVRSRGEQPFADVADLAARAQLERGDLDRLAGAGALATLAGHRHQAHWRARAVEPVRPLLAARPGKVGTDPGKLGTGPFFPKEKWGPSPLSPSPVSPLDDGIVLPAPAEGADIVEDYRTLGLTLGRHPLALLRESARLPRCRTARELEALPSGRFVQVAGLVTCRQRPGTASGVLFLTLEDETGNINVVVWRDCQERHRRALIGARLLLVKGTVETREAVTHVIAGRLEDRSALLGKLLTRSRDFH